MELPPPPRRATDSEIRGLIEVARRGGLSSSYTTRGNAPISGIDLNVYVLETAPKMKDYPPGLRRSCRIILAEIFEDEIEGKERAVKSPTKPRRERGVVMTLQRK